MTKKRTSKVVSKSPVKAKVMTIKDPRTGGDVVVHGFGAMANSDFKLKKGMSLLKPIAAQALPRSRKLKAS